MSRFSSRLEKVSNISEVSEAQRPKQERTVVTKTHSKQRTSKSAKSNQIPIMQKVERKEVRTYSLSPSTIRKLEEEKVRSGYPSTSLLVQTILDKYFNEVKE